MYRTFISWYSSLLISVDVTGAVFLVCYCHFIWYISDIFRVCAFYYFVDFVFILCLQIAIIVGFFLLFAKLDWSNQTYWLCLNSNPNPIPYVFIYYKV